MSKFIQLKDGIKIINGCVGDCPFYLKDRCGCFLIGIKSYGFCGNDPNPKFTPPLSKCPLLDTEPKEDPRHDSVYQRLEALEKKHANSDQMIDKRITELRLEQGLSIVPKIQRLERARDLILNRLQALEDQELLFGLFRVHYPGYCACCVHSRQPPYVCPYVLKLKECGSERTKCPKRDVPPEQHPDYKVDKK